MTERQTRPLHGLLIVDKPGLEGPTPQQPGGGDRHLLTSHDVVLMVRRWSGQRRIGHTGTLDPMASGVLVLCLGIATRLVEYYQGHDKVYLAEITLGAATDTYDVLGQVTETAPVPPLTPEQIEQALERFRGAIEQIPPVYSALKQEGERLHVRARRGEAVTVKPRAVTIHRLDLVGFHPPDRLTIRVHCSAGTYIRSLAHDIGRALGTVAHLSRLRRERVGPFSLEQAHTLDEIKAAAEAGELERLLLPVGAGIDLPAIPLDQDAIRRLGQGQKIRLPLPQDVAAGLKVWSLAQAVDPRGQMVGILRVLELPEEPGGPALVKAHKWFAHHLQPVPAQDAAHHPAGEQESTSS